MMERLKILALCSKEAADLVHCLKKVLDARDSYGFEVGVEFIGADQQPFDESILSKTIARANPQVLVLCMKQSDWPQAGAIIDTARKRLQTVPIVFVKPASEPEEWLELLKLGPDDFLTPPFRPVEVLPRFWRLHARSSEGDPVVHQLKEKLGLKQLVGESPALLAEIQKISRVARCDASVLISGETGTGKEMFARAIHFLGARSSKPFNALNCGAIPVDLLENELFGHEAGAFTSANGSHGGLLRATDGGSLFLDEVDCLPLLAQAKFLRFLQEKEFRPLGSQKACRVDVRVIAASNVILEEAVRNGRFRPDLYFRLNVIGLHLPPLRERKEDISLLARHFVEKYAAAFDAPARDLSVAALQKLMLHDWPGNVRELENVIERAVVLCAQAVLRPEDLKLPTAVAETEESFQTLKNKLIAQFERGYVQDLLRANHGNITRAARAAGKNRRAFWEIMRKHDIKLGPRLR